MTRKLNALDQIMDYLSESYDKGGLMLQEEELGENFFDLSTGLAGELFQKFTNYNSRLALVIADPGRYNKRFQELAYEHKSHPGVRVFSTVEAARDWLNAQVA